MGCATVIRNHTGSWRSAISLSVEQGSAFLAEIRALELGLHTTMVLGYKKVRCSSDCAQLVTVLNSGSDFSTFWDRENIRRVMNLITEFERCTVKHIDRDKNNTTDTFAREAARTGSSSQTWAMPPSFAATSIYLDSFS
ncbi:uncharacterized protein LOC130721617 [Lotus japonicus]|uniref:uncharacterized protein LOC130721617 n=1 Tax=Lotus japonicus TaxID=34305 RepID=UPI002585C8B8|nr:uncharacterized protein LOC130721617 [Lotus japonicus]